MSNNITRGTLYSQYVCYTNV